MNAGVKKKCRATAAKSGLCALLGFFSSRRSTRKRAGIGLSSLRRLLDLVATCLSGRKQLDSSSRSTSEERKLAAKNTGAAAKTMVDRFGSNPLFLAAAVLCRSMYAQPCRPFRERSVF